jgi:cysteine desulfurase
VVEAMLPYWSEHFGNSESSHAFGQAAANGLEQARQTVADVLNCRSAEVVFTGSGTEADNLALRGAAWAARQSGRGKHIVTSPIEHHAVGETVDQLCDLFGLEVTRVPVDEYGRVDPGDVSSAIRPDTILVSIMMANNEVGTVQPVVKIGRVCQERGVLFHVDAVQAAGRLPLELDDINVDLLALSAHKFYGPKGVGVLYVRRDTPLVPVMTGGSHERGRRPSTVNVAGAVGLATALVLAEEVRVAECARLRRLRNQLIEGVLASVPDSRLTGHPSSGAACAEGEPVPSFVLEAMGLSPEWSIGGLRLTLGRGNDEADVARVLEVLPGIVERLRADEGEMSSRADSCCSKRRRG